MTKWSHAGCQGEVPKHFPYPAASSLPNPPNDSTSLSADDTQNKGTLPRRRSVPMGFDFDLEEVWWPRTQLRNALNNSARLQVDDNDNPMDKIVPPLYYSRHRLLRGTNNNLLSSSLPSERSPTPMAKKEIILPRSESITPVYSYSPSHSVTQPLPAPYPSRAHDGTVLALEDPESPDSRDNDDIFLWE